MSNPRVFVSFSSTDIRDYRLMQAWKKNEHHNFNFVDCQLAEEIRSEDEAYIKRKCRERINMASTVVLLIGKDTKSKHKYVRWEIEVALEKGCRIICVNLDCARKLNTATCPNIVSNIGAIFVSYNQKIIKYALDNYEMKSSGNYYYSDSVYEGLGL